MCTIWYIFFLYGYKSISVCCKQEKIRCIFNIDNIMIRIMHVLCETIILFFIIIHTNRFVVFFKQDVYPVNVEYSTKIHFPPHRLVRRACSYHLCSRARLCVSINCVISVVLLRIDIVCISF